MLGLLCVSSTPIYACINSYTLDLIPNRYDTAKERIEVYQEQLNSFKKDYTATSNYKKQNDYAVLLIMTDRFAEAIQLLQNIEKQHPGLAKTAVNLGTAYELSGQYKLAEQWIQKGMQRDPKIHQGSEWIHVNILQAKQNIQSQPDWFTRHPILNIDFGKRYFPEAVTLSKQKIFIEQLQQTKEQVTIQLTERSQFLFDQDPVVARVYYDLANIEESLYKTSFVNHFLSNPDAMQLISNAKSLGLKQTEIEKKRIEMIESPGFFQRAIMLIQYFFHRLFGG